MKTLFEFKTLTEFTDYFCDEKTCREAFAGLRWRNGEFCPFCNHREIYHFKSGTRYRCAKCKQDFGIKQGTVFGDSKLPLRKWFIALYLLSTSGKGISSYQLAKQLGVTQKTAWFVNHRIRQAMKQGAGQLFGQVEADETYIGGKSKNRHARQRPVRGRGPVGKFTVVGAIQRGGSVRAAVVSAPSKPELRNFIRLNVKSGATLFTDEHPGYEGIAGYSGDIIRHSFGEYSKGLAHTNNIESFWALFKRGYHGIYHYMSRKHLQRYVNEYCYRFNRRNGEMKGIFAETLNNMATGRHLTLRQLVDEPII